MRAILFAFSILVSLSCFSQTQETSSELSGNQPEYHHLIFDKSDGYLIDELNAMEFDDDGWLWLSGIKYESVNYKLGARDPIVLRFNGQSFYEVHIPEDILEGVSNLVLQKSFENSFYVKLESEQNSRLFKLDARSLNFKEIERPETSVGKGSKFELLKLRDRFLYIQNHLDGNKLFYLDSNDLFQSIGTMKTNANVIGSRAVDLGDQIVLCKFNFGSEVFSKEGEHQIGSPSSILRKDIVESFFYKNSEVYLNFVEEPTIYKYNNETGDVEETNLIESSGSTNQFNNQIIFQDKRENILIERIDGEHSNLNIYSDIESDPIWSYKFNHITAEGSIFASRDLAQELIIENNNELEIFIFNSEIIKTYLRNLSIRDMTQLEDNSIIITTDFNGWYILGADRQVVNPFWPMRINKKMSPLLNRNISAKNDVVWSNDGRDLLKVDLNSQEAHTYNIINNISAMTQDEDRIIVADQENNVKIFDKESFQIETIIEKDSVIYENLIIIRNSIYAATSGGLKIIQGLKTNLLNPSNIAENNYVISLLEYNQEQLLLGTRSGELFAFDLTRKTFSLLFQDDLEASIASILIDDKNRIWLNTFAGIVVFNPKTKETIRFGMNDGLSHHEANRFSALKLSDGKFMVGTVKGVNYFHPDSLIDSHNKNRYNHKLQFVSIERFDKDQKSVRSILDRNQLDSLQSITLPADNNNLVLEFGILKPRMDIGYNYRYRFDNSDWIDLDKKHEIRLLNMESGKYKLQIQAIDKTKIEVLSTLSLGLVVEEFFYESIWFYGILLVIISFIIFIYSFKSRQANKAHFKNKLLRTEIEYKKKDLADFASNISRNQQWNDYLISKMAEIKETKGRKKGAALVNLEKEIQEKNSILESNFEFQKRIDVLSNEFYISLIERFPSLSKTEVKLCSLIRLDLDNNDIAILQNVAVSSVYKSRYRLRKKLDITSDTDLNTFLKSF